MPLLSDGVGLTQPGVEILVEIRERTQPGMMDVIARGRPACAAAA
jgi:hypothetical protein